MKQLTKELLPDDTKATFSYRKQEFLVCNEFTAVIEQGDEWLVAHCLEIPNALGQGKTREDVLENLAEAILLMLEIGREENLREAPVEAIREVIVVQ